MKRFVFRFEKVLQMRIDEESAVKNKLAKINQKIYDKELDLEKALKENQRFLEYIEMSMKTGIKASELHHMSHNKTYMTKLIDKLKHELMVYYEERKRVQKELIEANKQRKVMEKLKEKEWEQYKVLEALEESKLVDQIVTYQSTKSRGEE
ncbi:MAG: flagellar export protein FliJ [Clostridia bacterium]|nr:flagellar export protein FliJ [Clostridia bacterium]